MADFGPPLQISQDDLLDVLKRNMEDHWIGGLLEDPTSLSVFVGWIAALLRVQDAIDENLYRGAFVLSAPGRAKATSVVRLQRPSGSAVTFTIGNRFLDDRGAIWRPSADFAVAASGGSQTVDVPIETERFGYYLDSFQPLTYQALDSLPDPNFVILAGPSPAAGGKAPVLEQHGEERNTPRTDGEMDAKYAARLVFLVDRVSPVAITDVVLAVMDGFSISKPVADLIALHGLRVVREPFRDSAQLAQRGLEGSQTPYLDSDFLDDVDGYLTRALDDGLGWFDVLIPTLVDPDEARQHYDDLDVDHGAFFDDPLLAFFDVPASPGLAAPIAALADELDQRRAACVGVRIIQGGDLSLIRHPSGTLVQAGDYVDQAGASTLAALVAALEDFEADDTYARSATGRAAGSALTAGDLLFSLAAVPSFVSVDRVVIRARVRRSQVGAGVNPGLAFLIRPTTAGSAQRALVDGFPKTIDHDDWREYACILQRNPITAAAWTVADLAGVVGVGIANTAAAGATDHLRVSELSIELVVSYG